jgi:ferredoxin-NADP reductase
LRGEGNTAMYARPVSRALDMTRILAAAVAAALQLPLAVLILLAPAPVGAQTPDEHQQHHPEAPAETLPAPSRPGMSGIDGMMMGSPPAKAVYPSLMDLPEMPAERRPELERRAGELMLDGTTLMSAAFERLTASTQRGDATAMQEATTQVREALARFESGLALRRAVAEARAPRDVALDWFRHELGLTPLTDTPPPHGLFGLSWFHYMVMLLLATFVVATVAMQFRRMRRAEALVSRLAGGTLMAAPPIEPASPVARPGATPAERGVALAPDLVPSRPNSWTGLLRVARIFQETPDVKSFRLAEPSGGLLPFLYLPGQFVTVTVGFDGQRDKRSYSLASSPTQRAYCEITVKREERGAISRFLHDQLKEGDTLEITAPSGRFTFTGEDADSVVLIAGGVGVTPLMSAVRYLTGLSWPGDVFFFFAVRGEADVIYREELEYLVRRHPNLHLVVVAERVESAGWPYGTGRINRELIEADVPRPASRRFHVCGPPPMMDAVKAILAELGVPAEQIRTEVFAGKEPPRPALQVPTARDTQVAIVTFAKSRRTAMLPPTRTVLEASEDVGVNIEYSCRTGTCGVCRTKLLDGTVTMEVEDGLEPGDKEAGIILACQARATADVTVDA